MLGLIGIFSNHIVRAHMTGGVLFEDIKLVVMVAKAMRVRLLHHHSLSGWLRTSSSNMFRYEVDQRTLPEIERP